MRISGPGTVGALPCSANASTGTSGSSSPSGFHALSTTSSAIVWVLPARVPAGTWLECVLARIAFAAGRGSGNRGSGGTSGACVTPNTMPSRSDGSTVDLVGGWRRSYAIRVPVHQTVQIANRDESWGWRGSCAKPSRRGGHDVSSLVSGRRAPRCVRRRPSETPVRRASCRWSR